MDVPANTRALHGNGDLSWFQSRAGLRFFSGGQCIVHPQVVRGIGVDADIRLGDCRGRGAGHLDRGCERILLR